MNIQHHGLWCGVRRVATVLLAALLAGTTLGCEDSAALPTTVEGAWLGEGVFRASAGSIDAKAQLELLSNGSYRFFMLEPSLLAMTGAETGTWTRDAQTLTLTPRASANAGRDNDDANTTGSVFQQLRSQNDTSTRPARELTIAANLADLRFNDGKLDLVFRPNPAVTAKLQSAGEVTSH